MRCRIAPAIARTLSWRPAARASPSSSRSSSISISSPGGTSLGTETPSGPSGPLTRPANHDHLRLRWGGPAGGPSPPAAAKPQSELDALAAAAGPLDVRVHELEPARHHRGGVLQRGAVQVDEALGVDEH